MSEKLEQLILRTITIIPGIVGIVSMDFDKSSRPLKEEKFLDGILVENTSKGFNLSIALLVKHNTNINVVIKEIDTAIRNILTKKTIKLQNLKIYIRGVK